MKITILCENSIGYENRKSCLASWGLSLFVEHKNTKILFDTGPSDIFIKNAKNLNINLEEVDFIVLSHHHWDHLGGLEFLEFTVEKKLICASLSPQPTKGTLNFKVINSQQPLEFSQDIFFLGEIPENPTEIKDDSAIAIKTSKGAIVITGCSYAGIINICEYAKQITKQNLYGVIGGFHLFEKDMDYVSEVIDYFREGKLDYLYPMHCVDFPVIARFITELNCKKYSTGDVIII